MLTHWFFGAFLFASGAYFFGSRIFDFILNSFNTLFFAIGFDAGFIPSLLIIMFCGAVIAALPDIISWLYGFSWSKESHSHRDNYSHSILWFFVLIIGACMISWQLALLTAVALFSHPLIDAVGLGFGVKIFFPYSLKSFYFQGGQPKLFYTENEINAIVRERNDDKWTKNIFRLPSSRPWILASEIISLLGLITLVVLAYII